MTDRKLTCVACKSAITKGDIAGSDLEFGGELKATNQPEYTADADTDLVATVGTLDEYSPMVRTTGNQTISGVKTLINPLEYTPGGWHNTSVTRSDIGEITLFAKLENQGVGNYLELEFMQSSNTAIFYGHLGIRHSDSPSLGWFVRKGFGVNNPLTQDSIVIAKDGDGNIYLGARRKVTYGGIETRVVKAYSYGTVQNLPCPYITWLTEPIQIGTGTDYTLTEAVE